MTVNKKLIRASNGSGEAVRATVTADRSPGSTIIIVDSVSNWPTSALIGTSGSLNPDNTITIKNVFEGHIDTSHIIIDAFSPGYTTDVGNVSGDVIVLKPSTPWANLMHDVLDVSLNDNGTIKNAAISDPAMFTDNVSPVKRATEYFLDYVASGLFWTADSAGTNTRASMTAGVVYINGKRLTVAAITARIFTASRDTYIDFVDAGNGTATPVYQEVTNNTASPTLAANSIRVGIIVTNGTSIPAAANINQGDTDKALPIISSNTLETCDSLGNLICPRDPERKVLACRNMPAAFGTTSTTDIIYAGTLLTINVPAMLNGRKARVEAGPMTLTNTAATSYVSAAVYQGTAVSGGTLLNRVYAVIPNTTGIEPAVVGKTITLATGTMNFFVAMSVQSGSGGINHYGGEQFRVELK